MDVERAGLSLAAWLFTYALHSTVLIGVAWLSAVALARLACTRAKLRDALPALRERLWKLALVGGLATASVQIAIGLDPWGGSLELPAASTAREVARERFVASTPVASVPVIDTQDRANPALLPPLTPSTLLPALAAKAVDLLAGEALRTIESAPRREPPVDQPVPLAHTAPLVEPRVWIAIGLALWALGVAWGALRWWSQWRTLHASLRERRTIASGPTHELFTTLCERAGLRAPVRLSRAPRLPAPITLGIARREICIPPRAESELTGDELAALLGHEIAHAKRRDPLWLAVARAIEVALFFQPLNRLVSTWMQDEAEYLCDDAAIVWSGERVALASCLTEIAGWIVHEPRTRLANAMAARGTRLTTRVRRLLDDEHEPRADERGGWISFAGTGASACVVALVPGVAVELPRAIETLPNHAQVALDERLERLETANAAWNTLVRTCDETARAPLAVIPVAAMPSSLDDAALAPAPCDETAPNVAAADAAATDAAADAVALIALAPSLTSELDALDSELEELRALARTRAIDTSVLVRLTVLENSLRRLRQQSQELEAWLSFAANEFAFPLASKETP